MEAKTNPFYELRERLYSCAAAGTMIITEDFRLKRAVESFEPIAGKNKVFARLHKMCADLFASEHAASDLADCIALADALAVTQGTYMDDAPTKPGAKHTGFVAQEIPHSKLVEYIEKIRKSRYDTMHFPEDFMMYAKDPRLVAAYLEMTDSNSEGVDRLSQMFEKACGESLIEPLYAAMDFDNPKATGRQLQYIKRLAGSRMNDAYVSIAENEAAPAGIRVKAIEAMTLEPDNADLLIRLYQTGKGKVKSAALMAIAILSPPQGEPIFEKLAEKFKTAYVEAFSLASYRVCSEYVRQWFEEWLGKKDKKGAGDYPYLAMVQMLGNKADVQDCFEKLAQAKGFSSFSRALSNDASASLELVLINNLITSDDAAFREMIFALYEKYPDRFFYSRLCVELERDAEHAFSSLSDDVFRYMRGALDMVRNLCLMPDGTYRILGQGVVRTYYPEGKALFASIPDSMLEVLADDGKVGEKWHTQDRFASLYRHLYLNCCRECDKKKVETALERLAWAMREVCPTQESVYFLAEHTDRPLEGLIRTFLVQEMKKKRKLLHGWLLTDYKMPQDLLVEELKGFLEDLERLRNELPKEMINSQISEVNAALKRLNAL